MLRSFKHINTSFLLSTEEIKDLSIRREFSRVLFDTFKDFDVQEADVKISFKFCFTDDISPFLLSKEGLRSQTISLTKDQLHFHDHELNFVVNLKDKFEVIIQINTKESFKQSLKIFHKAFKNNLESQASIFYYRVFLLFSQLWNIQNNYSYLHAAAFSKNNGAVLCSSDSGVGKSSLLFRLSQEKEYDFISDDLTIINNKGRAYFLGRPLSVKPYHINYFPFLRNKVIKIMPFLQKLQWRIVKDSRLLFRLSYKDLFKNKANEMNIKLFLHLCNHSKDTFEIRDISSNELLSISSTILNTEFFLFFQKLNNIASIPSSPFPSSIHVMDKVQEIYLESYQKIPKKLILIPYQSNPNHLYEFLKSEGCLS